MGDNVLDLSNQALSNVLAVSGISPKIAIYDQNSIGKIENLDGYPELSQLSIADNRLVKISGLNKLTNLTVLNLPNNSIGVIDGLKSLSKLAWLNLSGNSIKIVENLSHCTRLEHLDLSDNSIVAIGDVSALNNLKTLLVHSNLIQSLTTCPVHLPSGLKILSLAENEIGDLNEVMCLKDLRHLEQLSILSNPCLICLDTELDYRPFVVNWCQDLRVLDGYPVSETESLKAEWLYSQGRGWAFRIGEHGLLVEYLAQVCPLTGHKVQNEEDAKLMKILDKRRQYKKQMHSDKFSPERPLTAVSRTRAKMAAERPRTAPERVPSRAPSGAPSEGLPPLAPELETLAAPRHAWKGNDEPNELESPEQNGSHEDQDLQVLDISNQEESNRSLLESESTYLIPMSADVEASPPRPIQLVNKSKLEQTDVRTELFHQAQRTNSEQNQRKRAAQSQQIDDSVDVESAVTEPALTTTKAAPASSIDQRKMKKAVRKSSTDGKQQNQQQANSESRLASHSPSPSDHSPMVQSETKPRFPDNPLHLPLTDSDDDTIRHRACVLIQALYRGWHTRNRDPRVRRLLQELRARRAEDHIRYLRGELERVIDMYEQEKKLRTLQFEAIKYLWTEVKALQKWQAQVTGSPVKGASGKNGASFSPQPVTAPQAQTCAELTQQVGQLQETVSTLTNYVFQGCVTCSTPSDDGIIVTASNVNVSGNVSNVSTPKSTYGGAWECIDSMEAEPASPKPGVPACPLEISMRGLTDTSLLVNWAAPETSQNLIGYRVYVNDLPKAMLSSANTSACIDGLQANLAYTLYIRTVSTLGESSNSCTLTARRARSPDRARGTPDGKPPVSRALIPDSGRDRLGSDDSTPPHTPKIMTRTRDTQPSSPESEDSNKENVLGEPPRGRKNRSLDRFTQIKVMPDKPEQMRKKSDEESPTKGEQQALEARAQEVKALEARAQALARRKERARSISLSEALGAEAESSGADLKKSSSSPDPFTNNGGVAIFAFVHTKKKKKKKKKKNNKECVDSHLNLSLRSCSPSPSSSLPARASSKDTLLKVQQSITDKSQLQDDSTDEIRRVTIRRSSSLKSNPDKYRLSPTGQVARLRRDSGGSDRASPVILGDRDGSPRDSSPELVNENEVEPSLRRGSSLKAKVKSEESSASPTSTNLRRSSSLKGNILPNRDMREDLSRTLPAEFSPSPQAVQPIVKEKNQEKSPKNKSPGLLSKFKSKK